MNEEKIKSRIKLFERCYLLLIVLTVALLLYGIAILVEYDTFEYIFGPALFLYIYIMIYIGLRCTKQWVASLILFTSAFGMLTVLFGLADTYDSPTEFAIYRAIDFAFMALFVYQMIFFSRRNVRRYFKATSRTFFN
ncbi:MAG: hypothetical protein OEW48_20950 [Phycisphaerae bacterium]|nr:hypothetical protein [Phycisphaerae bacterium]